MGVFGMVMRIVEFLGCPKQMWSFGREKLNEIN